MILQVDTVAGVRKPFVPDSISVPTRDAMIREIVAKDARVPDVVVIATSSSGTPLSPRSGASSSADDEALRVRRRARALPLSCCRSQRNLSLSTRLRRRISNSVISAPAAAAAVVTGCTELTDALAMTGVVTGWTGTGRAALASVSALVSARHSEGPPQRKQGS